MNTGTHLTLANSVLKPVGMVTALRTRGAGEWQENLGSLYHLALWEAPDVGEASHDKSAFVPYRRIPGTLSSFISGGTVGVRAFNRHRAVFCQIHPEYLQSIEAEMDLPLKGSFHDHLGFTDPALRDLLRLLVREVEGGGENGELYTDSLHLAVGTRLLRLGREFRTLAAPSSRLPTHLLRRCTEFIEANHGSTIDVATLAKQTGYSRAHFMKIFSATTGSPPHRYLLSLRLEKARALVLANDMPMAEIAAVCGFSSQTHLTTAFRRRYGLPPAQFARSFQKSRAWPK